jgi:hypothetical protein
MCPHLQTRLKNQGQHDDKVNNEAVMHDHSRLKPLSLPTENSCGRARQGKTLINGLAYSLPYSDCQLVPCL